MTTPFQPLPCGGLADADVVDVEQLLLCDVLPDGTVVGSALAVYEYDENGNPTGPPIFVVPGTNTPYVPQGVLQPCGGDVCLDPMQFCFTSSATVDQPGRTYDVDLPLAQGFAVEALLVDLVEYPLNVEWSVNDADGSAFADALEAATGTQFPGATVTVTPPALLSTCGDPETFHVHIECMRLDQDPPSVVQYRYNAGRDLIQNPAFVTTPPSPNAGPTFISRQDAGGTINCTSVANRGWETNDVNQLFEYWGYTQNPPGVSNLNAADQTTPTPRNTPVQEINAFGGPAGAPVTIWQTFNVPAPGNFNIRVTVGGRTAPVEAIGIKLSSGDTGAGGAGDVINTVVNAPRVTNELGGIPGAWTNYSSVVPLAAGLYTLAFTGPSAPPSTPSSGGLFTDMRVFADLPGQIATFDTDDDTCTVEVTATSTACEFWAPQCTGGVIAGWRRVSDGAVMTNAAFWAQVPAPVCCLPDAGDGTGGSVGNLVDSYAVCAVVGGVRQTVQRVIITDQSGGIILQQFLGEGGAPVVPLSWTPGECGAEVPLEVGEVCYTGAQAVGDFTTATPVSLNSFQVGDFAGSGETLSITQTPQQLGPLSANTSGGGIGLLIGLLSGSATPQDDLLTIDLGRNYGAAELDLELFGTTSNDRLREITPAPLAVAGAGVIVGGNGVNPTAPDGNVTLTFGPTRVISFRFLTDGTVPDFARVARLRVSEVRRASAVHQPDDSVLYYDTETGALVDAPAIIDCPCCCGDAPGVSLGPVCYEAGDDLGTNLNGGWLQSSAPNGPVPTLAAVLALPYTPQAPFGGGTLGSATGPITGVTRNSLTTQLPGAAAGFAYLRRSFTLTRAVDRVKLWGVADDIFQRIIIDGAVVFDYSVDPPQGAIRTVPLDLAAGSHDLILEWRNTVAPNESAIADMRFLWAGSHTATAVKTCDGLTRFYDDATGVELHSPTVVTCEPAETCSPLLLGEVCYTLPGNEDAPRCPYAVPAGWQITDGAGCDLGDDPGAGAPPAGGPGGGNQGPVWGAINDPVDVIYWDQGGGFGLTGWGSLQTGPVPMAAIFGASPAAPGVYPFTVAGVTGHVTITEPWQTLVTGGWGPSSPPGRIRWAFDAPVNDFTIGVDAGFGDGDGAQALNDVRGGNVNVVLSGGRAGAVRDCDGAVTLYDMLTGLSLPASAAVVNCATSDLCGAPVALGEVCYSPPVVLPDQPLPVTNLFMQGVAFNDAPGEDICNVVPAPTAETGWTVVGACRNPTIGAPTLSWAGPLQSMALEYGSAVSANVDGGVIVSFSSTETGPITWATNLTPMNVGEQRQSDLLAGGRFVRITYLSGPGGTLGPRMEGAASIGVHRTATSNVAPVRFQLETFGPGGIVSETFAHAAVTRECDGTITFTDLLTGIPLDLGAVTLAACPSDSAGGEAEVCVQCETLELCDITEVPTLDGARSALDLTALANGPTAGAFPNGIGFTVDQGVAGGSGTYLITTNTTQNWTFGEPAMLRFGVNNLNVGAECVTLPVGTVVEAIHPNHVYNAGTRVLCNGGAAAGTDESIFTLAGATSLAITSNAGGGGQRGLVRLEAGRVSIVEVLTPFLRTICRTCGEGPTVTDTALDAVTPYVPVGTVGVCNGPSEGCLDSEIIDLCYTFEGGLINLYDETQPGGQGWIVSMWPGGNAAPFPPDNGLGGAAVGVMIVPGLFRLAGRADTTAGQVGVPTQSAYQKIFVSGGGVAQLNLGLFSADDATNSIVVNGVPYAPVPGVLNIPVLPGVNVVEIVVDNLVPTNTSVGGMLGIDLPAGVIPFRRVITYGCEGQVIGSADYSADGVTPFVPPGPVGTCAQTAEANPNIQGTVQAHDGLGAAATVIPAGARAITLIVSAGDVSVLIGAGPAAVLPAGGYTWAVDQGGPSGERLGDVYQFTGGIGDVWTVHTTREV